MSEDVTHVNGALGIRDLVMDHGRRLGGLEDRERRIVDALNEVRLAINGLSSRVESCEKPLRTFNKIAMAFVCAFAVLVAGGLYRMFANRIPEAVTPGRSGESLPGLDPRPLPPRGDHVQ